MPRCSCGTPIRQLWQNAWAKVLGQQPAAGGRARPQRQALQGQGLAGKHRLRFPQAVLPDLRQLGAGHGEERRRRGRAHPPQGALLCGADRQRRLALELRLHQPGSAAHHARHQWRQPDRGPEAPAGRHADAGRPPAHQADRHDGLRDRPQHRDDAGQGGVPQRDLRADPVFAHARRDLRISRSSSSRRGSTSSTSSTSTPRSPSSSGRWTRASPCSSSPG